jgi:hypothetical protein
MTRVFTRVIGQGEHSCTKPRETDRASMIDALPVTGRRGMFSGPRRSTPPLYGYQARRRLN